jgi:hypothetical protein
VDFIFLLVGRERGKEIFESRNFAMTNQLSFFLSLASLPDVTEAGSLTITNGGGSAAT